MITFESFFGLVIVLFFTAMIIFFSQKKIRSKFPFTFRRIPSVNKLRRAIGLAVEDGTRIHISLGSANIIDFSNTSALVGLSSLQRIGQLTSTSDFPPIVTSGNGSLAILSQDVLRNVSIETNTRDLFDPDHAQLTGVTPFSYSVGTIEAMSGSSTNTNVLVGNFGSEAGFLCDASNEKGGYTLAASDSISAQSIFYAVSQDTLLGEELYALPAYLALHPAHLSSLRVQDIFRFILAASLVVGSLLTILGII